MTAAVGELVRGVTYEVTEEEIATARDRYAALSCETKEGYEEVRLAIGHLRSTRTAIEKRRVELKADALEYGRRVDSVAKRLTGLIVDIEEPLKAKKAVIDDEAERVKREAEKAELLALEAKLREEREAAEAKAKAEREAEEARLAAERARLAAQEAAQAEERRKVEAHQQAERERLDAQRVALAEQQKTVEAQQREIARQEANRLAAARAIEDAARAKVAAEEEAARVAAMAPDVDKLMAFASAIRELAGQVPTLEAPKAGEAAWWGVSQLKKIAATLERFKA